MVSFDSVSDRLKEKDNLKNVPLKITTNDGPRQSRKVVGLFKGNINMKTISSDMDIQKKKKKQKKTSCGKAVVKTRKISILV